MRIIKFYFLFPNFCSLVLILSASFVVLNPSGISIFYSLIFTFLYWLVSFAKEYTSRRMFLNQYFPHVLNFKINLVLLQLFENNVNCNLTTLLAATFLAVVTKRDSFFNFQLVD